jgi:hypothetical protein
MTKRFPPHNPEFECQKCGGPCQRKYTHDADGNEVDSMYWHYLKSEFQVVVEAFRNAGNDGAAEVALRLVETTDDIPAELVQRQMDFWLEPTEFDNREDAPDAMLDIPQDKHDEMIAEIGRGTYVPATATAYVTEYIRRVNEARRARPWIWPAIP